MATATPLTAAAIKTASQLFGLNHWKDTKKDDPTFNAWQQLGHIWHKTFGSLDNITWECDTHSLAEVKVASWAADPTMTLGTAPFTPLQRPIKPSFW